MNIELIKQFFDSITDNIHKLTEFIVSENPKRVWLAIPLGIAITVPLEGLTDIGPAGAFEQKPTVLNSSLLWHHILRLDDYAFE